MKALGPAFDDIELLFFESAPESQPSDAELEELRILKSEWELTYSVHTPLDVSLASVSAQERSRAVDAISRSIARAQRLGPERYVLHVYLGDREHDPEPPRDLDAWRDRARQSLAQLLREVPSPRQLCIESLDYDLTLLSPVLEDLDLGVALDIGHFARDHRTLELAMTRLLPRTRIIQVHGTDEERDHRSLSHFPLLAARELMRRLRSSEYSGVFTLEVFHPEHLATSVETLERWLAWPS